MCSIVCISLDQHNSTQITNENHFGASKRKSGTRKGKDAKLAFNPLTDADRDSTLTLKRGGRQCKLIPGSQGTPPITPGLTHDKSNTVKLDIELFGDVNLPRIIFKSVSVHS